MEVFINLLIGIALGWNINNFIISRKIKIKLKNKDDMIRRYKTYYNTLNLWLHSKSEGKIIEEYFLNNEYNNISIYGNGELGNLLYNELKYSKINISYIIDNNNNNNNMIPIYKSNEKLPMVDVIIVSVVYDFDKIKEELENKIECDIISLERVVFEM